MAAASTQKLQDIVECPICLETLTEPRMFGCFHFYCQKCVHDMKEVQQDETVGYECPLCRKLTTKNDIKALPIMSQLMDAIAGIEVISECDTCSHEKPTWRCLDCKENYCLSCKADHSKFKMFRSHKIEKISASSKPTIDELVLCDIHSSEAVKLHCRDCKQLICLLCNGTTHKQHTAETIEEALQQVLPLVRENQEKVKVVIDTTKTSMEEAKIKQQKSKEAFVEVRKDAKDMYDEMMRRLKEDYAALSKEIDVLEEEANAKHEARVKQLELQLQSQENVLSLSQSTLDTAQNISLLKALQSGVQDSLNGSLSGADTAQEVDQPDVEFDKRVVTKENLLGSIKTKQSYSSSCLLEIPCDELLTNTFTMQSKNDIDLACLRFDIINGNLWCVKESSSSIHIFSTEMVKKGTVKSTMFGEARSVIAFNDKAIVSAINGLFTVSTRKQHDVKKIFHGAFCDLSLSKNHLFALKKNSGVIYVIQNVNDKFVKQWELRLQSYSDQTWNTIQATPDHVFVALFNIHVIYQYTLDGQLVREHGRPDRYVGGLQYPLLSGSDSFNNILIAGNENPRVDVLRADGSFGSLPLTGLSSFVRCARIYKGKLYVMTDTSLIIYTIA